MIIIPDRRMSITLIISWTGKYSQSFMMCCGMHSYAILCKCWRNCFQSWIQIEIITKSYIYWILLMFSWEAGSISIIWPLSIMHLKLINLIDLCQGAFKYQHYCGNVKFISIYRHKTGSWNNDFVNFDVNVMLKQ